jgi:hypothetical protein
MMPVGAMPNFSLATSTSSASDARVNNLTGGMFNQSGLSVGSLLTIGLIVIVALLIIKKA